MLGRIVLFIILLLLIPPRGYAQDAEHALQELQQLGIPYTGEEFGHRVEQGDLSAVKLFLEAGIDPNTMQMFEVACSDEKCPVLMIAAAKGHTEIVNALLKAGADVHLTSEGGYRTLHEAVKRGHTETVLALINNENFDVTREPGRCLTPLMWAAVYGHAEMVRVLVQHGEDINAKTTDGETALMMAAFHNHIEIMDYLIASGANISATRDDGETALHSLVNCFGGCEKNWIGYNEMIKVLLDGGVDVNLRGASGQTPLINAAYCAPNNILNTLLKRGADVNAQGELGNTALMGASFYGNIDAIALLLSHGADPNLQDDSGNTALMSASARGYAIGNADTATIGNAGAVALLLDNGANPNVCNEDGTTPLMIAAKNGSTEIAEMLLNHGANVNAKDNSGDTALTQAAKWGSADIARLLLDRGAGVDVTDGNGDPPLISATKLDHIDTLRVLLEKGADPNIKDSEGKTALMQAAWEGKREMVELLLQSHADVNINNNLGMTALTGAEFRDYTNIAKLLRRAGAKSLPNETKATVKNSLLSSAKIAGVSCECLCEYTKNSDLGILDEKFAISVVFAVMDSEGKVANLGGVILPFELKIRALNYEDSGAKIEDRVVYHKAGFIDLGNPYIFIPREDVEKMELGVEGGPGAEVSITLPDGTIIRSEYCLCGMTMEF